jgi:hypothetical protein
MICPRRRRSPRAATQDGYTIRFHVEPPLKIIELELELEPGRLCRYPSTTEFEFHAAWCRSCGLPN